jgi:biopolymer transport protein ExbD
VKLSRQERDEPDVNLASLIDFVFLLLIFFMVSTTFERQTALKVDLPETTAQSSDAVEKSLELVIDAEGRMYLGERALVNSQRTTLRAALLEAIAGDPEQPVILRADAMTPHHHVVTAMDVMGQVGISNISIATTLLEDQR